MSFTELSKRITNHITNLREIETKLINESSKIEEGNIDKLNEFLFILEKPRKLIALCEITIKSLEYVIRNEEGFGEIEFSKEELIDMKECNRTWRMLPLKYTPETNHTDLSDKEMTQKQSLAYFYLCFQRVVYFKEQYIENEFNEINYLIILFKNLLQ